MKRTIPSNPIAFYIIVFIVLVLCLGDTDRTAAQRRSKPVSAARTKTPTGKWSGLSRTVDQGKTRIFFMTVNFDEKTIDDGNCANQGRITSISQDLILVDWSQCGTENVRYSIVNGTLSAKGDIAGNRNSPLGIKRSWTLTQTVVQQRTTAIKTEPPLNTNGPLTRKLAAEMFTRDVEKTPPITISAGCRMGLSDCGAVLQLPEFYLYGNSIPTLAVVREDIYRHKEIAVLYDLGYAEINENHQLVLTDKGRKASAGWTQATGLAQTRWWNIPVAKYELVAITGISSTKENEALVTYTLRQKPINDIGEALDYHQTLNGSITLIKFDDGWRFKQP